jgi:hypothetical protein
MVAHVFGSFSFVAVPVRTASDQPYRLQKFKLRLFYASDIRQPNLEVIVKSIVWFIKICRKCKRIVNSKNLNLRRT